MMILYSGSHIFLLCYYCTVGGSTCKMSLHSARSNAGCCKAPKTVRTDIVPLKSVEYGVYGDLL